MTTQEGERADFAACMLGAFQHMLTHDDALQALAAAHRALRPGGLLVIELGHPAEIFEGHVCEHGDHWELQLPDGQVCTALRGRCGWAPPMLVSCIGVFASALCSSM